MKKLQTKLWYWIMPKEFKQGAWFMNNGNIFNIDEFFIKKGKYWELVIKLLAK